MALSSTRILSSLLVLIVIACGIEGCAREYEGTTQYEACKESIELQYNTSKIFSIFLFRNWFPIFICNSDMCRYAQFVDNGQCLREYFYTKPDAKFLEPQLRFAILDGNITLVRKALYQGAKVNAKDEDGMTALMKSAGFGHTDIVEVLLTEDADVNAKNNIGMTALMYAVWGDVPTDIGKALATNNIVKVLLAKGAHVNDKDNDGMTALMHTAAWGHTYIVKVLLAKGAHVNDKDNDGKTALSLAKEHGYTDIVQLLKQAGAVMADEATKKPQETVRDLFHDPTFATASLWTKIERFQKAFENDHEFQKLGNDSKESLHQKLFSSKALADPPQPR